MKKTLLKFLNSKRGFSLAEVMVAAGLMGIVSLVMMNSFQVTTNTTKRANQDLVIESAVSRLRGILNKVRKPDTPAAVRTCTDTIINGAGALQAPNVGDVFTGPDLGEGVRVNNIAVAFADGGVAERRPVNITITFDVRRDRQVRQVTRVLQTMVSIAPDDVTVTNCLGYNATRISDEATDNSCLLIFQNCIANSPLTATLTGILSDRICEALGSTDANDDGLCDNIVVERRLDSTNIKLNGSDADEICLAGDGGVCRQRFDNSPCPPGEQLKSMGVAGDPAAKVCVPVVFPTAISNPPGTCPQMPAPSVTNCTLPQVLAPPSGDPNITFNGMCSGSGSCSAECQDDGTWTNDTGSCGGEVPNLSWCQITPGQSAVGCSTGKNASPPAGATNSRGQFYWSCVDSSMTSPNDRVACRTCLNNFSGHTDGVDIVDGSCVCPSGQTGTCSVTCNTSCGCANNDIACNTACNNNNGWVVGTNTCTTEPPSPITLALGSGSSSMGSPEMTLLWDAGTANFIEKDGSPITPSSQINLNSYITLYGGVPPYTGTWTISDSTWRVTNTTTDPSTSIVYFTSDNTASFLTQLVPDYARIDLDVTDSVGNNSSSSMWVEVTRDIDCSDYTISPSGSWGSGLGSAVTNCSNDYTAAKNDCTSNGCYIYGEVISFDTGGSTYNDCNRNNSADKEFQVDCRETQSSCAGTSSVSWSEGSHNCTSNTPTLPSSNDGTIITVNDTNTSGGATGSASFQCVGTTWKKIVNHSSYPSTCSPSVCDDDDLPSIAGTDWGLSGGTTPVGDTIVGSCTGGYSGSPTATCGGSGWTTGGTACSLSPCNVHDTLADCESDYGSGNCKVIDGTVTTTSYYFDSQEGSTSGWNCGGGAQPAQEGACPTNSSSCPSMMSGSGSAVSCSNAGHVGISFNCYYWYDDGWTNPTNRSAKRLTCSYGSSTPQQYTSNTCGSYSCTPDCSEGPGPDGCGGTCSFACSATSSGIPGAPLPHGNVGDTHQRTSPDPGCIDTFSRTHYYECDPINAGGASGWHLLGACCTGGPLCI